MDRAVTIDFHDTLFICDEWFELEVRQLLPAFLRWYGQATGTSLAAGVDQAAAERYRVLREAIMEHGIEQDALQCVLAVCDELKIAVDTYTAAEGLRELMHGTLRGARPRHGARSLVEDLRAAGVRLGIVSNAIYHPFLEWALADHGLDDAFDVVTTSASAGFYKSRGEIYLQTIERLGVRPQRAAHIGDSFRFDVLGAARVGMATVWLDLNGEAGPERRADVVTTSLEGLAPTILAELDRRAEHEG